MVPFNISSESVKQLKKMVERSPEAKPEYGVRLYISGLCGFGPAWGLTLDTYDPNLDECCEFDGLKVIVERDLLHAVGGLDVQFEASTSDNDEDAEGGFLITALAPEIQALYGGGCGGCGGGCHGGGCGGCGHGEDGDCDGDCEGCDGDCEHCGCH